MLRAGVGPMHCIENDRAAVAGELNGTTGGGADALAEPAGLDALAALDALGGAAADATADADGAGGASEAFADSAGFAGSGRAGAAVGDEQPHKMRPAKAANGSLRWIMPP